MMADALLSSLVSVNSAFHWAAYFAYSSAIMFWIHSWVCHFTCSSVDGLPSLVLLLLLFLPLFEASYLKNIVHTSCVCQLPCCCAKRSWRTRCLLWPLVEERISWRECLWIQRWKAEELCIVLSRWLVPLVSFVSRSSDDGRCSPLIVSEC